MPETTNDRASQRIVYPESDGKPSAESPIHLAALIRALLILEDFFAADPLVYLGAEDQRKLGVYGRLPVGEYVLYDPRPLVRRRTPALQGYRLSTEGYEAIPKAPDGGLVSRALALRLVVEAGVLQWYDQATGRRFLDPRERAEAGAQSRRAAEARARAAEARLAELEARLRQRPPPSA